MLIEWFLSIKRLPNLLFGVLCLPGDQSHPFAQPSINPLARCICWAGSLGRVVFPPWNEGPNFGSYIFTLKMAFPKVYTKCSWRRARQPTPVFLPGEFPWTEEPGRLPSIESQRVRHDWNAWAHMHAHIPNAMLNHKYQHLTIFLICKKDNFILFKLEHLENQSSIKQVSFL